MSCEKYNLERFSEAQKYAYGHAYSEIKNGKKRTHWMWFIFPQLKALGRSNTAMYYGIENIEEAKAYILHPVLGTRLREISESLLRLETNDPLSVMGYPDNLKLCSSMTLFAQATDDNQVFVNVINKFFGGVFDQYTLDILKEQENNDDKS